MKLKLFGLILAVAVLVAPVGRGRAQQEQFPFQIFERYLEPLVQQIGMPGLSAVILQNGSIAWSRSYGYADVEQKIPTSIDTPYAVGGVTQAVTGVLVGVCIDRLQLDIDNDIRLFVPTFPVANTQIRQVLAHATDGRFQYNATNYQALTPVVAQCSKQSFRQAMATEVLDRLALQRSVPGLDLARSEGAALREQFDPRMWVRYQSVLRDVAVPYRIDSKARSSRSEYPSYGLDAASGLVSTAADLARFEGELDRRSGTPLSFSTLDQMWSNATFSFSNGLTLTTPTGLGWFVTNESGQRLVWTFGHIPDASSALIVKLPSKRLTLIMLANSGGLAQGYNLENASVTSSPFVKIFLRLFI